MTLPLPDLTKLVAAIEKNTTILQLVVDELVTMNEREQNGVDEQVMDIRNTMERQYRQTIENLEQRMPKFGHVLDPNAKASGGLGARPGADPESV